MNIFNKIALQSLKKNPTRTFVTIIGIILSTALITGITTFGISLIDYMSNGATQKYGSWHLMFLDVPKTFVEETLKDEEIAQAAVLKNIGYAKLEGSKNPDKPYLFLTGCDTQNLDLLGIKLLSGRLPQNNHEVLISLSVSANGGIKYEIGDTLHLTIGNRLGNNTFLTQHDPYSYEKEQLISNYRQNYTVVGIYQRPSFEEVTAPGYTMMTKTDTITDILPLVNEVTNRQLEMNPQSDTFNLAIELKNPYDLQRYAKSKDQSYLLNDNVLRFRGLSDDHLFNTLFYTIGSIVLLIVMIGSIFLIYNAFNISLNERTHQFGILMSVGATEKQLCYSVLFEGFCLGLMSIPIGVILGIGSISLVLKAVEKNFTNILYEGIPLTTTLSLSILLLAIIISLVTILISAYIPARKATRMPVMECIKQTNDIKVNAKEIKTSKWVERLYGLEGILALKNFKRNKRRYLSVILSLSLSVILFIVVNAFILDLKQVSERAIVFTTYDVGLATKEIPDNKMIDLYQQLKPLEEVEDSGYQALAEYQCMVRTCDLSPAYLNHYGLQASDDLIRLPVDLQFVDDTTYLKLVREAGIEENALSNNAFIAIGKMEHEQIGKMLEASEFVDMFANKHLDLMVTPLGTNHSAQNIKVTFGNYVAPDMLPIVEQREIKPYFFTINIPYSLKDKFKIDDSQLVIKGLTFNTNNASQLVDKIEQIMTYENIKDNYTLYNMRKMLDESYNMIFIANTFAYTFIVVISLIAIANVFNTISTNIKMRKRELAMLRSIGISEHSFQKMMYFESALYGGQALLVGLPIAIILSWLIFKGINEESIDFILPWNSIYMSIISVLVIVFVTMLSELRKIKKETIIDVLRDELT